MKEIHNRKADLKETCANVGALCATLVKKRDRTAKRYLFLISGIQLGHYGDEQKDKRQANGIEMWKIFYNDRNVMIVVRLPSSRLCTKDCVSELEYEL